MSETDRTVNVMGNTRNTGYRRPSNNLNQLPLKVVTKLQHTDPVMSSSLQNIPNGLSTHQNITTGSHKNNHHQIYDTKKLLMNQSTPSLAMRDVHLSPRDPSNIGRGGGGTGGGGGGGNVLLEPTYITHSLAQTYNSTNNFIGRTNDRSPNMGALQMVRSQGVDGIYGAQRIHHPMNYSDSNLIQQNETPPNNRIYSTSSSTESVHSSSSRDNISSPYNQYHPPPPPIPSQPNITPPNTGYDYKTSYSIRDSEISQSFSPKKIQRGKPVAKSKFGQSGRDKV